MWLVNIINILVWGIFIIGITMLFLAGYICVFGKTWEKNRTPKRGQRAKQINRKHRHRHPVYHLWPWNRPDLRK